MLQVQILAHPSVKAAEIGKLWTAAHCLRKYFTLITSHIAQALYLGPEIPHVRDRDNF